MTGRSYLAVGFFLVLLVLAAGCTSLSVGNVSYGAGNLSVTIAGAGTPAGTGVQVRIYKLDEFEQHELLTTGTTATLSGTETTVAIPMHLVRAGTRYLFTLPPMDSARPPSSGILPCDTHDAILP